jgi:hypothetical protein
MGQVVTTYFMQRTLKYLRNPYVRQKKHCQLNTFTVHYIFTKSHIQIILLLLKMDKHSSLGLTKTYFTYKNHTHKLCPYSSSQGHLMYIKYDTRISIHNNGSTLRQVWNWHTFHHRTNSIRRSLDSVPILLEI